MATQVYQAPTPRGLLHPRNSAVPGVTHSSLPERHGAALNPDCNRASRYALRERMQWPRFKNPYRFRRI